MGGVGDGREGADEGDLARQVRVLVHHHIVTRHPLPVTQYLQSDNGNVELMMKGKSKIIYYCDPKVRYVW